MRNDTVEPKDRYFQTLCSLPEREIRSGPSAAAGKRKPSYTTMVLKAVALGLKEFPYANRRVFRRPWPPFSGPRLQRFEVCDVAVAVERDMPGRESVAFIDIVRDAERRSTEEITEQLRLLSESGAARFFRRIVEILENAETELR